LSRDNPVYHEMLKECDEPLNRTEPYECSAIEDNPINKTAVDVLEGTYPAFDTRRRKYHKPAPGVYTTETWTA